MPFHKVFKIVPKRARAANGESIAPGMELVLTTKNPMGNPFSNGAVEVIEAYKRTFGFDYRKCGCMPTDFDWYPLD